PCGVGVVRTLVPTAVAELLADLRGVRGPGGEAVGVCPVVAIVRDRLRGVVPCSRRERTRDGCWLQDRLAAMVEQEGRHMLPPGRICSIRIGSLVLFFAVFSATCCSALTRSPMECSVVLCP